MTDNDTASATTCAGILCELTKKAVKKTAACMRKRLFKLPYNQCANMFTDL